MARNVLRLKLSAGEFAVLADPAEAQSCYTNSVGTSFTAYATPESLLAFADGIIAAFRIQAAAA